MSNIDVIKKGVNSDRVNSACSDSGISLFVFCPHKAGATQVLRKGKKFRFTSTLTISVLYSVSYMHKTCLAYLS